MLLFLACSAQAKKFEAETVERLRVFHLEGSSSENTFHAAKLATPGSNKNGVMPFVANLVHNTVYQTAVIRENPILKIFVPAFLSLSYYNSFIGSLESSFRLSLDSMAFGMDFDRTWARRSLVNPDIIHFLIADSIEGRLGFGLLNDKPSTLVAPMIRTRMGCSSFIALPSITKDGRTYFGRVQDYPGVNVWDRYPAIYYHKKPNKYRYVSVGSEGMAFGAITAMNEHGLTMAVHSTLVKNPNKKGHTLLYVTQKMIEEARTIEEAEQICRNYPFASGWLIAMGDIKNGQSRAARLEVDPKNKKCHVVWADSNKGFIAQTNLYENPIAHEDEILLGPAVDDYSQERLTRLRNLLTENSGKIDALESIKILSDRYDIRIGRAMSFPPSAISATDQLLAVVMVPETREIWVGNGTAPVGSSGKMVHFNFDDFEQIQNLSHRDSSQDIDLDREFQGTPNSLSSWPAYPFYKKAFQAATSQFDYKVAEEWLSKAIDVEPHEPIYYFLRGLVALRNQNLLRASRDFQLILDPESRLKNLDYHRYLVSQLYLANVYDLTNKRSLAQDLYQAVIEAEGVYPPLKKAAENYLAKPFTKSKLSGIEPDLKLADTISYE